MNQFVDILQKTQTIVTPKHLSVFLKTLKQSKEESVLKIILASKEAIQYANCCGLCVKCQNCAYKQYDNIINSNIHDRMISNSIKPYFKNMPQMYYYISEYTRQRPIVKIENKLICLKGFSSSTPIINSAKDSTSCFGGGFYINYNGNGIVIDPGVDFVKNMHRNYISIQDIDVVIVTHNHMDHNSDIEKLSSLQYDLNRYYNQCNEMLDILNTNPYTSHNITWILDSIDYECFHDKNDNVIELDEFTTEKPIVSDKHNILLRSIETNHIADKKASYAIRIKMDDMYIGYTSDTPYNEDLIPFFNDMGILIFNISDIYENDVQGIKNKKGHLGYNGSYNLLKETHPSLAIASEFCCTNGDIRNDIVAQLISDLKSSSFVIPGEIGTTISIPDLLIKCSICHRDVEKNMILHISPDVPYGKLRHICKNCLHSGNFNIL